MNKMDSKPLAELVQATNSLVNPAIKSWRGKGGKVVGYFCSFVPEEIISAAGLLPFRIRATGSKGTELSDGYMSSVNCSFSRNCLNMALSGEYDFLDGAAWVNSCDQVRRIYDIWKRKLETPFVQILSLPRKTGEEQVQWYRDELSTFRHCLGEHFGIEITDEHLWQAIRLHNETRCLQRKIYDLRKMKCPPITGSEVLAIVVAGTAMPKEHYNKLLTQLLDEIGGVEGDVDYRARLMIMGSILDDPEYVRVIEEAGGLVVADSLCFGSRILWKDVTYGTGDPLTALARYYIAERPSCPRMCEVFPQRVKFVRDMIREFKVDAVIGQRLRFCDCWGFENYMFEKEFQDDKFPFLMIDREYLLGSTGQMRTRVQAFLETLKGDA
jgi:bcr-type benzoyl-CoA reductase subunit C